MPAVLQLFVDRWQLQMSGRPFAATAEREVFTGLSDNLSLHGDEHRSS